MTRLLLACAVLSASACSQQDEPPAQDPCGLPAKVTYAEHIGPWVQTNCASCHHSGVSGAARKGAPSGVDFDDEGRFVPFAALSLQRLAEGTHPAPPRPERCELVQLRAFVGGPTPAGSDAAADATIDAPRDGPGPGGDSTFDTVSPDVCASGTQLCGGSCVDTQSDGAHCGGCNKPCSGGTVCRTGQCSADCGSLTKCGQSCADTQVSTQHCGGCDKPCVTGQSCSAGQCRCPSGQVVCAGACVDTQSSAQHCGGCNKPCAGGKSCSGGSCSCAAGGVSFSKDVQPIFNSSCATAGCHLGVVPKEGLDLSGASAYKELVDVNSKQCAGRKLVSSSGQASYLLDKLRGVNLCRGTQMPKQGASLPSQQIDTIAGWICEGAKNN